MCAMCQDEGRIRAAEMVHHIKPIRDGGTHEEKNLMSICQMHHNQIHQGFKGHGYYGNGRQGD